MLQYDGLLQLKLHKCGPQRTKFREHSRDYKHKHIREDKLKMHLDGHIELKWVKKEQDMVWTDLA